LDEVKLGHTDLFDAFKNPEDGFLFEVTTSFKDSYSGHRNMAER